MKSHHYIVAGVTGYFLFLLLLTPAATVISFLNLPAKNISLSGVSGSIWSGQIEQAQIKNQSLENVLWSLNPFSLFTGSVVTDLQADIFNNPVEAKLDYSYINNSTSLHNVISYLKAEDLQKKLNLPFGELSGNLKLDFEQIIINPKALPTLLGNVQWQNAKLTLSEKISFGNILLDLKSDNEGNLIGKLSNTKGELALKGDIKVTAKSIYTLRIGLKPRANAPAELLSIINLIAPRKEKGEHVVSKSGHLRQLGIKL